mmetsp:Transcript_882/g.2985  ORF Transcript_882/g.2985 Transcript_882/m.2985 type:complete len:281 (-) Transcript_882:95-937(-)
MWCRRCGGTARGCMTRVFFRATGLTNTVKAEQNFSRERDRQTMPGELWWEAIGDAGTREALASKLRELGAAASAATGRDLHLGEVTYNRYEPGASLGPHLDEHHEESKGRKGWLLATRRSLSWLLYLNPAPSGGQLRCYVRDAAGRVGAAPNGDVQVGYWRREPRRPVFLGDDTENPGRLRAYVLGGDDHCREATVGDPIAPPFVDHPDVRPIIADDDGAVRRLDVEPRAGTLVLFDSVAVPHEVLTVTSDGPRLAATGWFHEFLPDPFQPEAPEVKAEF